VASLDDSERAELERLRAEVARLRAQSGPAAAARAGRWLAAVLLLVLSSAAGVAALVGVFARTEVLDTDRYVETVAPLAREPAVQQAVADRVTDELVTRLDLTGLTQRLADALERQGAPAALDGLVGPVTGGIRSFIRTEVETVLASDQFAQVWDTANRVAHDQLDAVLTTGRSQFLLVDGDTLRLDVGAIFAAVKQRLADAGFTLVNNLPDISVTVPLLASDQIPELQQWVRLLDAAAWVLPLAALGLLAAAIAVAPDRRRALLLGALGLATGMLGLLATLAAGRDYYLANLPDSVRSPAAAAAVYDTLLRFLVAGAQSLLVVAALVAAAGWLAGPGRVATAIRRGGGWLLDRAAAGVARLGLPLGGAPAGFHRHRVAIELSLAIAALAVLVVWRHPGVSGTLWLAAGLVVAIGLVELVARLAGVRAPAPAAGR
jgi:hypothetical protein